MKIKGEINHGLSGYQHHKCRCDVCKAAKKKYEKERVGKNGSEFVGPKPINHGTQGAYTYHGCRCEICSAFIRGYRQGLKSRVDESNLYAGMSDDELLEPLKEKHNEHGTAEAYSLGCTCDVCKSQGHQLWLRKVVA